MTRIVTVLAVFFVAATAPAVWAQATLTEELPEIPSMPHVQDCEDLRSAHERVSARLREEALGAQGDQAGRKSEEADTVVARGRLLYDDCLRKSFSGGGGMGG